MRKKKEEKQKKKSAPKTELSCFDFSDLSTTAKVPSADKSQTKTEARKHCLIDI